MNEQEKQSTSSKSGNSASVITPTAPPIVHEMRGDYYDYEQTSVGGRKYGRLHKLRKEIKSIGIDRLFELSLTCAIVYLAHSQVKIAESTSKGNTEQTKKLIQAAQMSAHSSAHNAAAAQSFSISAGEINKGIERAVGKLNLQAGATEKAADATKSAAQTAKETLHVSERAYVVIEDPSFGFSTKSVFLPLVNSGHIPSGEMISVVHEATYNVATPTDQINYTILNQIDWQHQRWDSILPGNHQSLVIPIPPLEEDRANAGTQMVVVAGSLTYNDGFVGSPQQKWKFCFRNWYQTVMKKAYLSPCNPEQILPYLEKADGYPNNEHPN